MLELLRIRDLALIEDISVEFAPGMNVLTGETGAGKSFILKALNFLLGEKLTTDMVRPGKSKAEVEALFVINGEERILRRELAADSGRSRVFLNDRLCSQDTLKEMRSGLILHTSQHGQQKLLQPAFQSRLLDDRLQRPDLLSEKDRLVRALSDISTKRNDLENEFKALDEKRDMLEFQQAEISKVNPRPGEEEELEQKRERLRAGGGIVKLAGEALAALHGEGESGILRLFPLLERNIAGLAKLDDTYAPSVEAVADMRLSLAELDSRLRRETARGSDEAEAEKIEERLYTLAQLKRKLKRPLEAILSLQEEINGNLEFLDTCALERKKLAAEEEALCAALAAVLAQLNPARQKAAEEFSVALQNELAGLGFSEHVRVIFEFTPHSLHQGREDCTELRARLNWQPNPGQHPQPLDRIASGGELSRFLLAVVSLTARDAEENPTLLFDEVDAGVGGLTLNRVAESLERLAGARQMLLITHWPQLAARAARHFVITKEIAEGQTYTRCEQLAPEAVTGELARMSGREAGSA